MVPLYVISTSFNCAGLNKFLVVAVISSLVVRCEQHVRCPHGLFKETALLLLVISVRSDRFGSTLNRSRSDTYGSVNKAGVETVSLWMGSVSVLYSAASPCFSMVHCACWAAFIKFANPCVSGRPSLLVLQSCLRTDRAR